MTTISVPYTLYKFGARRFTVEWILDPQNATDVYIGDPFEAIDADLVSVHALSASGILCKLYGSNLEAAKTDPSQGVLSNISDSIVLPSGSDVIYFPPMRFYWPTAEDVASFSRVSLLFEGI